MRAFSFLGRAAAAFALVALGTAAAQMKVGSSIAAAGAVGDGHTLNTKAIQNLIDKTAGAGGGTIVVPAGVFVTGALFFSRASVCLSRRAGC